MSSSNNDNLKKEYLRKLPAVGKLIEHPVIMELSDTCPRALLLEAVRQVIGKYKSIILYAQTEEQISALNLSVDSLLDEISGLAAEKARRSMRLAINATGDVLCDSMGRAPFDKKMLNTILEVLAGYSTLALNGDRNDHVKNLLSVLTGAQSWTPASRLPCFYGGTDHHPWHASAAPRCFLCVHGLGFATLLTLMVIPVVYAIVFRVQ